MLSQNIEIIKSAVTEYIGTGMYVALFLVALLYIFLKEENKNIKAFIGWLSIIILFIALNPIFSKVVGSVFTKSVYWRLFWMLPMGLCLAYVAVKIVNARNKKAEKILVTISLIAIIIISGKFIYTEQNYKKVGNAYKISDEIVNITYLIKEDETEHKKVMLPPTLVAYIRQIDGNIELMYARNPQGYANNQLVLELESGNVEYIATTCKEQKCNYIIFNKATPLNGNMERYGYNLFEQTQNYNIYKCDDV